MPNTALVTKVLIDEINIPGNIDIIILKKLWQQEQGTGLTVTSPMTSLFPDCIQIVLFAVWYRLYTGEYQAHRGVEI